MLYETNHLLLDTKVTNLLFGFFFLFNSLAQETDNGIAYKIPQYKNTKQT